MKTVYSKKSHKAFYVALGICLIAVAVAVYLGVNGMVNKLSDNQSIDLSQQYAEEDWKAPETEDVTKEQPDVKKEETEVSMAQELENESAAEPTAAAAPQFMLPLEGEVLNAFSNGELVKSKTLNEWRTHDGTDLKAAADTPVKAIADGTVEEVTEDPMWGMCVSITHNGNYTSYYKGLKPNVQVTAGQSVRIGDVIGAVGNTAEIEVAEDSHLHFAVKQDGQWIDPMSLVSAK